MTLVLRTYALYHRKKIILLATALPGIYCVGQLFVSSTLGIAVFSLIKSLVCHIQYDRRYHSGFSWDSGRGYGRPNLLRVRGPSGVSSSIIVNSDTRLIHCTPSPQIVYVSILYRPDDHDNKCWQAASLCPLCHVNNTLWFSHIWPNSGQNIIHIESTSRSSCDFAFAKIAHERRCVSFCCICS